MSLRINHGALEIKNGFTHYPQEREAWRLFLSDPLLPLRIILLDGSGALTLDVISWLSVQNIPLIRLDYRGDAVSVIGSGGIGADPDLLKVQVAAAHDTECALAIPIWLISEKLIASCKTLLVVASDAVAKSKALDRMVADMIRLSQQRVEARDVLMGLEGKCAQVYFDALRNIPVAWKESVVGQSLEVGT